MRASFVWAAVAVTLAGCAQEPPTPAPERSASPMSPGRAGTVDTIAGPGFCRGISVRNRSSEETGALTVDREGRLLFDTGPAEDPFIARVEPDGRVAKLRHLTPRGPYDQDPARPGLPSAGRLAADGQGGVFIAAGSKVVHVDRIGALRNIAGDPKHPPSPTGSGKAGDGGPAEAARFFSARSIASDEAGNLFIADARGAGGRARAYVRFINRTQEPVVIYPGTTGAITVQPGHITTVAGAGQDGETPAASLPAGGLPALAISGPRLYISTFSPGRSGRDPESTLTFVNLSGGPISAHGATVEPGKAKALLPQGAPPQAPTSRSGSKSVNGPIAALAAEASGNLHLADSASHRVMKMGADGSMRLFAGGQAERPAPGFNGNDRRAAGAALNMPFGAAMGPDGRIYISDRRNHQVRFVDQAGVIRAAPGAGIGLRWTCARPEGQNPSPGPAEGRGRTPAPGAPLSVPGGPANAAAGRKGTVYFTTSLGHQVKAVDGSGRVFNLAGSGRPDTCNGARARPQSGGEAPKRAALRNPTALALVSNGVYVTDCNNARISFINLTKDPGRIHGLAAPPQAMITLAGSGKPGYGGDGQKAWEAQIGGSTARRLPPAAHPALEEADVLPPDVSFGALAADGRGNLYLADTGNARIRRIGRSGTISTVAGEGKQGALADCCRSPSGLAADRRGNLYVIDTAGLKVWFLNLGRLPLTVKGVRVPAGSAAPIAGNGTVGFEGEGGPAAEAQLLFPMAIALDRADNLYVAEVGAAPGTTLFDPVIRGVSVRKVDTSGTIKTVVGPGHVGFNGDGLKPNLTSLSFPSGIAFDRCGNLLVADLGSDRVRRVNLEPNC